MTENPYSGSQTSKPIVSDNYVLAHATRENGPNNVQIKNFTPLKSQDHHVQDPKTIRKLIVPYESNGETSHTQRNMVEFTMTEKSYPVSQTSKPSVSDYYVLAHATRESGLKNVQTKNFTSRTMPFKSQNHPQVQTRETLRKCKNSTASSLHTRVRLPLNMIVSKTATRETQHKNNGDPLEGLDLSTIRNSQHLQPSWRENNLNTRRLQSAYIHNKRKIEEIQAMKARLKIPRYNPSGLRQRDEHFKNVSQSQQTVMESEDPLPKGFDQGLNDKENFPLTSTPLNHPTEEKFVWNPVILPAPHSFRNAKEFLDFHHSPCERKGLREPHWDSPGTHTTSSTSSGLTVAEETVRLTYYARSGLRNPAKICQPASEIERFIFDPLENIVEEWCPPRRVSNYRNYFEE